MPDGIGSESGEEARVTVVGRSAYRAGGFYNAPQRLESLREAEGAAIRVLLPHVSYPRPAGRLSSTGDPAYADAMYEWCAHLDRSFRTLAPATACELAGVVLKNQVVYLPAGGGFIPLYETLRHIDAPYTSVSETADLEGAATMAPGLYCYLGSVGFGNYGHWLVDDLPRALLAAQAAREPITWVLPAFETGLDRSKARSLDTVFGAPQTVIFAEPAVPVRAPRLLYVSPVTYHPTLKSPAALRGVRAAAVGARRGSRRLFVGRASALTRRLLNEAEIEAVLAPLGFETIDAGVMSFDQQLEAFAEAEIVVGVMGAAMTNTLFCREGAGLIYLAPQEWSEPFYWDLAAVMGHDYSCIYGAATPEDRPSHLRDFSVDPDAVLTMVRERLASPGAGADAPA